MRLRERNLGSRVSGVPRWRAACMLLPVLVGCAGVDRGGAPLEAGWRVLSSDPTSKVVDVAVVVGSGCRRLHDMQVKEHDERVKIVALVVQESGRCTADCNEERASVMLRSPLGSRRIDGPERLATRC